MRSFSAVAATRDCTVCGESWDDTCRPFGTAIISPCPRHHILRRQSNQLLLSSSTIPSASLVPSSLIFNDALSSDQSLRKKDFSVSASYSGGSEFVRKTSLIVESPSIRFSNLLHEGGTLGIQKMLPAELSSTTCIPSSSSSSLSSSLSSSSSSSSSSAPFFSSSSSSSSLTSSSSNLSSSSASTDVSSQLKSSNSFKGISRERLPTDLEDVSYTTKTSDNYDTINKKDQQQHQLATSNTTSLREKNNASLSYIQHSNNNSNNNSNNHSGMATVEEEHSGSASYTPTSRSTRDIARYDHVTIDIPVMSPPQHSSSSSSSSASSAHIPVPASSASTFPPSAAPASLGTKPFAIDTLPDSVIDAFTQAKNKRRRNFWESQWSCGGLFCSFRCIFSTLTGMCTKKGWLRTWWKGLGNDEKRYLSREEFELSLNSYAELLRLLDFYIVQRESGQLDAEEPSRMPSVKKRKPKEHSSLRSDENRTRQDYYLEAFIIGMTRLLRGSGSPAWRLDYQIVRVAEGLGLKNMTFKVFPAFVMAAIPERTTAKGGNALCFGASPGYDMHKLIKADNLARSVAALATNTDSFEHMVLPSLSKDVQKIVVAIGNSPETLDQVYGFAYEKPEKKTPHHPSHVRGMRMRAKLEDAETYMTMLTQHLGSKDAAVNQLKQRILELAHRGTGFFSFDIPRLSKELNPNWGVEDEGKAIVRYELRRLAFLEISLEYALTELDVIEKTPKIFSKSNQIVFGGVTAMCAVGLFFKGSWYDVLLCFCLGSFIAFIANNMTSKSFLRLFECLAAFIVGFSCVICAVMYPRLFCYSTCSIAAVVNLVQGVSITMAVVELATKNMVSGTSRLFYALLVSIMIGMGTTIGAQVGLLFMPAVGLTGYDVSLPTTCQNTPVQWWTWPILLACFTIASCGKYGAGIKLMPAMLASMWLAYGVSLGTKPLGDTLSNILAAFSVGVFSNLIQKAASWFTPFVPTMGGLMLLVPGSMAVRGFSSILNSNGSNDITGLTLTYRVLFTAITLGLGLFLSSLIVTPAELLDKWKHTTHKRTLKALRI